MTRNQSIGLAAAFFVIGLLIGAFVLGKLVYPAEEVVKEITKEVVVTQEVVVTEEVVVTKEVLIEVTPAVPPGPVMDLATLAEKIRAGEIDVGEDFSMEPGKRYHNIHVTVLGLGCTGCHAQSFAAQDELFFDQDTSSNAPSPVDRIACLSCHEMGFATALYSTSP